MAKSTGDEYFDSEEFRELLSEYETCMNTGQPVFMDADELAEIADYYQLSNRPADADAVIDLAMEMHPGAAAPLTYRIHQALYDGDTELAWKLLDQIVETDEPDYAYCRGEILLSEERADEANEFFEEQLATVPEDELQDYVVDVASIFTDYNYPEKAMLWMARASQEDSADFKELQGRTLFGLGKYKDSQRIFNELIDTDPFSKYYWNALASAQFMDEDYSSAIQSSEYAIAIDPKDPDGLIAKANGLFRLGNYEEALVYFRRYSEEVPDDEYGVMHQGTCLINMGELEQAVDTLLRALELANSNGSDDYVCDIYQELAFAYCEMDEPDKALDYLDRTDDLDCDHVAIMVIKGHVMLSAGRLAEAEEEFRRAVLASDDPNQVLLRVIVSLYDNHYVDAAYDLFRKFFDIVPDDYPNGYAYMALCCHDLKKYDEFLSYLKKGCALNPKECQLVVGHLFPEEVAPKDYYNYIKDKMQP